MTDRKISIPNPLLQVDVVERGRTSKKGWTRCEIGENIYFSTMDLETYCFAPWEQVVYDAMLVAASVEFCDKIKKRSGLAWAREIELRVPVHEPERWNAREVSNSLVDALSLLTGDCWKIKFVARHQEEIPIRQTRLRLPSGARAVIPYSNGMDSRSVAGIVSNQLGDGLIRLRISQKINERPAQRRRKQPFTSVPFEVRPGSHRFVESSVRSRGFKFALVSGLAAYLAETEDVIFPESGQGVLAPALLVPGHGYEDYRNHPLFTSCMERFLASLLNHRVHYLFPRLWYTKGETLLAFLETAEEPEFWKTTRSCWQSSRQVSVNRRQRQCGVCAACMLRRMSVHAAGLSESPEQYVWEDLRTNTFESGAAADFDRKKITKALRQYAVAGALHLDHLAGIRKAKVKASMLKRNAFKLSQVLNLSQAETESKLERLLKQHEDEWQTFLDALGPNTFIKEWIQVRDEYATR